VDGQLIAVSLAGVGQSGAVERENRIVGTQDYLNVIAVGGTVQQGRLGCEKRQLAGVSPSESEAFGGAPAAGTGARLRRGPSRQRRYRRPRLSPRCRPCSCALARHDIRPGTPASGSVGRPPTSRPRDDRNRPVGRR
jgi:hypothetical protein